MIKPEYFSAYWYIQNLLCMLFNKTIYIIIDAINENEAQEFVESLPSFINNMLKYHSVKMMVSCRSEYFDLKYKELLVDKVEEEFIRIDMNLEKKNPDGSRRFRYYLFLFLRFLQWKGKEEIEKYFVKVCDTERVEQELKGMIFFEKEGEDDESEVQ